MSFSIAVPTERPKDVQADQASLDLLGLSQPWFRVKDFGNVVVPDLFPQVGWVGQISTQGS